MKLTKKSRFTHLVDAATRWGFTAQTVARAQRAAAQPAYALLRSKELAGQVTLIQEQAENRRLAVSRNLAFLLDRPRAAGHFGRFCEAVRIGRGDQIWAVKCIPLRDASHGPDMVARETQALRKSGRTTRLLLDTIADEILLVTDFVGDSDLEEVLDALYRLENFGAVKIRTVMRCRLELLARVVPQILAIHNQGLAHRDLKAANVFVDRNGELVVGDFGLSCETSRPRHTRCGTRGRLPPELFADAAYQAQPVDLWEFGWLVFEILLGSWELSEAIILETEAAMHAGSALPESFTNAVDSAIDEVQGLTCWGAPAELPAFLRRVFDPVPARRPGLDECPDLARYPAELTKVFTMLDLGAVHAERREALLATAALDFDET